MKEVRAWRQTFFIDRACSSGTNMKAAATSVSRENLKLGLQNLENRLVTSPTNPAPKTLAHELRGLLLEAY